MIFGWCIWTSTACSSKKDFPRLHEVRILDRHDDS